MEVKEEMDIFLSKKLKCDITEVKNINLTKKMSLLEENKTLYLKVKEYLRDEGYII